MVAAASAVSTRSLVAHQRAKRVAAKTRRRDTGWRKSAPVLIQAEDVPGRVARDAERFKHSSRLWVELNSFRGSPRRFARSAQCQKRERERGFAMSARRAFCSLVMRILQQRESLLSSASGRENKRARRSIRKHARIQREDIQTVDLLPRRTGCSREHLVLYINSANAVLFSMAARTPESAFAG